jgi:hypothetical protein
MADVVFDRCSGIDLSLDSSLANPVSAMVAHNVVLTDGKVTVRNARRKIQGVEFLNPPTGMARVAVGSTAVTLIVANTASEAWNHLYKLVEVTDNSATVTELTGITLSKTVASHFVEIAGRVFVSDGTNTYEITSLTPGSGIVTHGSVTFAPTIIEQEQLFPSGLPLYTYTASQSWHGYPTDDVSGFADIVVRDDSTNKGYKLTTDMAHDAMGPFYVYTDDLGISGTIDLSTYNSLEITLLDSTVVAWDDVIHWQFGHSTNGTDWFWYDLGANDPVRFVRNINLTQHDITTRNAINYIGFKYVGQTTHYTNTYLLGIKEIRAFGGIGGGAESLGLREYYFVRENSLGAKSVPDKSLHQGYLSINVGDTIVKGMQPRFRVTAWISDPSFVGYPSQLGEGDILHIYRTVSGIPYELVQTVEGFMRLSTASSISEAGGVYTITLPSKHHFTTGDVVRIGQIASNGTDPADFNGDHEVTVTTDYAFTITPGTDIDAHAGMVVTDWEISPLYYYITDTESDESIVFNDQYDVLRCAVPAAKAMASWRGCLWLANTQRTETSGIVYETMTLYKSELANPIHFSTDQFPLNPNDAMCIKIDSSISGSASNYHNEILALIPLPETFLNELLVFTTRGVFAVRGNDNTDFQVRHSSNYGCKAGQSPCVTPNGVYWLAPEGIVTYPDNVVIPQVRPIVNGITPFYLEGTPYIHAPWGENALGFYANQKYRLFANDRTGLGLVYDFNCGAWTTEDVWESFTYCVKNLPGDNNEVFISTWDSVKSKYILSVLDDPNEITDNDDYDEYGQPLDQIQWIYAPHWMLGATIQSWYYKKGYLAFNDSELVGRNDNTLSLFFYKNRDMWSDASGNSIINLESVTNPNNPYRVYELKTGVASVKGNEFGIMVMGYATPGSKLLGIHLSFESAGNFSPWTP